MQLAYLVTDKETGSAIVFAATEKEAAEIGASKLLSEAEYVQVTRAANYDHYSSQEYVPIKILYEDYWNFGCWQCDRAVYIEINEDDDEDEDDHVDPIFEEQRVFCCEKCQNSFYASLERRKQEREEARQFLLKKFPGIVITSICGGDEYPVNIDFNFPGGTRSVRWSSNKKTIIRVAQIDLKTWTLFCQTTQAIPPTDN